MSLYTLFCILCDRSIEVHTSFVSGDKLYCSECGEPLELSIDETNGVTYE